MKGSVHSIETFGTVDGPGIRYVLFLSGCLLQCSFCHNPDTWEPGNREMTVNEVVCDMARYHNFYDRSGGGLTASGGEPLLQAKFVASLFKKCQEQGIHTLLDTSGYAHTDKLKKVLAYADSIQFSIKVVDPQKHQQITASENDAILANLRLAASTQIPMTIRYVVIPTMNDTTQDLIHLAKLVKSLPKEVPVELLAYHTMGLEKWKKLRWRYSLPNIREATQQDLETAKLILNGHDIDVRC